MNKSNILILISITWIIIAFVFFKVPESLNFEEREISFEGKIIEFPDVRTSKTFLVVEPGEILSSLIVESGDRIPLGSRIRISVNDFVNYQYGEYLFVEGILKEPENFSDFNWRGYLAKEKIGYVMTNPKIEKTGKIDYGLFYFASRTREKMQENINNSLLPPHSALYSAMILGNKSGLTRESKDNLAKAGLSHIVAISGMHIGIIIVTLFFVLLSFGLWRHYASYLALFILVLYIILIGAPASAMRAGIMAAVLILSERIGRPNSTWRALLYAATIMVAFNPYIVRYDIGFQLSYLAVMGILLLKKPIEDWLWKVPQIFIPFIYKTKDNKLTREIVESNVLGARSLLALTLSAQVFTFPLILYNFGTMSTVSPITNILVLPILPFALGAGFITTIGGSISGTMVGTILAAPAWLFSSYIWSVINLFS